MVRVVQVGSEGRYVPPKILSPSGRLYLEGRQVPAAGAVDKKKKIIVPLWIAADPGRQQQGEIDFLRSLFQ